MNFIKEEKNRRIIDAAMLIVLGILICCFYNAAASVFVVVSGVVAIVFGCLYIAAYFSTFLVHDAMLLIRGLFLILIGSSIMSDPGVYLYVMVFAVSFFLIYVGVEELAYSLDLHTLGIKNWWVDLVASIIYLCLGTAILIVEFTGGNSVQAVMWISGGSLIFEGAMELVLILALHRDYKKRKPHDVVSDQ